VRITDFGLAALTTGVAGDDVRSGTPAYMAPEQLEGREVTTASDIYALGVVLYELFTGRKPFEGKTLAALTRQHREETPREPSRLVEDIDLAVERVILRCLDKDPRLRPPSALAVAAALPGGDPLAAALAAGETPSPEMVAASGAMEGLSPAQAWGWVLGAAAVVALALVLARSFQLVGQVSLDKPPPALEDRAREILGALEHDELTRGGRPSISRTPTEPQQQLGLFQSPSPAADRVVERLLALDPNRLTPIEALSLLADLKKDVQDS
jgi:serine/threonine-protein kinase